MAVERDSTSSGVGVRQGKPVGEQFLVLYRSDTYAWRVLKPLGQDNLTWSSEEKARRAAAQASQAVGSQAVLLQVSALSVIEGKG